MSSQESGGDAVNKIRRIARNWSIIVILFALIVGIGEIVFPHGGDDAEIIEYFMPITMFLRALSLGLAWRAELLGGALNIGFYIINFILYWVVNDELLPFAGLLVLGLAIVPGILFLVCWSKSRQSPIGPA